MVNIQSQDRNQSSIIDDLEGLKESTLATKGDIYEAHQSLYVKIQKLQGHYMTFRKFVGQDQSIKVQMELVEYTIKDLVRWLEEHTYGPKNIPRLNYLDSK